MRVIKPLSAKLFNTSFFCCVRQPVSFLVPVSLPKIRSQSPQLVRKHLPHVPSSEQQPPAPTLRHPLSGAGTTLAPRLRLTRSRKAEYTVSMFPSILSLLLNGRGCRFTSILNVENDINPCVGSTDEAVRPPSPALAAVTRPSARQPLFAGHGVKVLAAKGCVELSAVIVLCIQELRMLDKNNFGCAKW